MTAAKGRKPAGPKAKAPGDSVEMLFRQLSEKIGPLEAEEPSCGAPFDYAGVIGLLDKILAIDPGNRDALNYKGMMLLGTSEHRKAIKCFDAILKASPADKEVLNNKGIALYGMGKAEEALKYIDKAIELDRRFPDALMNKAVILHDLGRSEEAQKFIMRARALDTIKG
jgi:tetratricopeptide (TPR) repeat protein